MSPTPPTGLGRPVRVRIDAVAVKHARDRAGIDREALAERVGTTPRTLQRIENEGMAGLALIKQICEVLQLPLAAGLRQDAEVIHASLRAYGFAPERPPKMFGRASELATLRSQLADPSERTVLVLEGPVGVGKTCLAQQLALDLAPDFDDGVVWVRGDFNDARRVKLDIARALTFDAMLPPEGADSCGRDWRQAFAHHLWQRRRLLVLDDVSDTAQVRAFVADDVRLKVLVTTRFKHIGDELTGGSIHVSPLDDGSIFEVLAACRERAELERNRDAVGRLIQFIGGMPGIAEAACTMLRRESLASPATWVARLTPDPAAPAGDRLTESTLSYYGGVMRQVSAAAREVFATFGMCGTEPVPLSWLAAAAGMAPGEVQVAASELLDAQLVALYPTQPSDEATEPWLRVAPHPAAAALALLGRRRSSDDTERARLVLPPRDAATGRDR